MTSSRIQKLERVADAARDLLEWEKLGCPDIDRLPSGVLEKRLAELDKPVALAYREWWEPREASNTPTNP